MFLLCHPQNICFAFCFTVARKLIKPHELWMDGWTDGWLDRWKDALCVRIYIFIYLKRDHSRHAIL